MTLSNRVESNQTIRSGNVTRYSTSSLSDSIDNAFDSILRRASRMTLLNI
jgi:hypothetical protein